MFLRKTTYIIRYLLLILCEFFHLSLFVIPAQAGILILNDLCEERSDVPAFGEDEAILSSNVILLNTVYIYTV